MITATATLVDTLCFSPPATSGSLTVPSSSDLDLLLDQWIIRKLASPSIHVEKHLNHLPSLLTSDDRP